jgi:hypothetical protein
MAQRLSERSMWRKAGEFVVYGLAVLIPAVYFARNQPPFDAWLERIEWRSPIVLDGGADTPGERGEATPRSPAPGPQKIYRCEQDGIPVISNRPCGNVLETRELAPSDINVVPSELFTGHAAPAPENVDCKALRAELDAADEKRGAPSANATASQAALERDALWQRGHESRCW